MTDAQPFPDPLGIALLTLVFGMLFVAVLATVVILG